MTDVQAPYDLSTATRSGPRVYRKQVLAHRTIDYPLSDGTTRRVVFDDAYCRDLAAAYQQGAYDLVPFQLATPANQHNEDPRQYGGRVLGAEATPDGLDLILELAEDTAELVERTGRKLGVSARIKEAVQHVDGRSFKRAIRHVLGTLDPRMQNLRPWEPVDLSTPDDPTDLIDLTGYTYQGGTTMPRYIDLSTLSDEQAEALESFAALTNIDLSEVTPEQPVPDETLDAPNDPENPDEPALDVSGEDELNDRDPDDEPDGISDDELEALIDAELADVELSNLDGPDDGPDPIDLAAGLLANAGMDKDEPGDTPPAEPNLRFQHEAAKYARKGVPPHLLDLAEPLLSLEPDDDSLDLSTPSGESVNVRGIVTAMLDAVAGTIDLSGETGYGHETQPDEQVTSTAQRWTEYLENN